MKISLTECPLEKDFGVLLGQRFFLQLTFWPVPLVNPVEHSHQGKGCRFRTDVSF
jgi:hypothetical protein